MPAPFWTFAFKPLYPLDSRFLLLCPWEAVVMVWQLGPCHPSGIPGLSSHFDLQLLERTWEENQ